VGDDNRGQSTCELAAEREAFDRVLWGRPHCSPKALRRHETVHSISDNDSDRVQESQHHPSTAQDSSPVASHVSTEASASAFIDHQSQIYAKPNSTNGCLAT
jgi:hypothetical protein